MRILFFTPYGGLSGSEKVLSNLLLYLKKRHQVALFSRERGEIFQILQRSLPVYTYEPNHGRLRALVARTMGTHSPTSAYDRFILNLHEQFQPDVWYLNTLVMPEVARLAAQQAIPYILHVHEMPMVYGTLFEDDLKQMIVGARLVIACSEATINSVRVLQPRSLELQYECISLEEVQFSSEGSINARQKMGISKSKRLWGMAGKVEFRKGADLFVEAARISQGTGHEFVWLGGAGQLAFQLYLEKYAESHGVKNVHFAGKLTTEYYDYLACLDGFLLTSREDPFPLVMIEAAALGKPIVAFNSGGVSEFVRPGMGVVVNSWNTADLVKAMTAVTDGTVTVSDDVLKKRAADFDVKVQAPKLEAMLERYVCPAGMSEGTYD